jgi:hypothetical protein
MLCMNELWICGCECCVWILCIVNVWILDTVNVLNFPAVELVYPIFYNFFSNFQANLQRLGMSHRRLTYVMYDEWLGHHRLTCVI